MQNYLQLLNSSDKYVTIEDIARNFNGLRDSYKHDRWVEVYREMLVHTQGHCPEITHFGIMQNGGISQEYLWRRSIFKPFSKEIFQRGISMVSRIFKESGFEINTSENVEQYINENRFNHTDLITYYQNNVFQRQIEDPNGFIVVLPIGDGARQVITNQRVEGAVEPYPFLVSSEQVKYIGTDWFIYEEGKGVYIAVSKNEVYSLVEYDNRLAATLLFTHNIGKLPIIQLGGLWNNYGYFESFFSSALPSANELLRVYSDWQIAERRMYYILEHDYFPCDYKDVERGLQCNEGRIIVDGLRTACPKCNGSGSFININNFFGVQRPKKDFDSSNVNNRPYVDFRNPAPEPYQILEKSVERLRLETERTLHLRYTEEAQSGTAKAIDREDKYAFLDQIARRFYNVLIYETLWLFEKYMNVNAEPSISVLMPLEFNTLTQTELREGTKAYLNEVPIPFLALNSMMKEVDRQVKGSDIEQKKFKVIMNIDKFLGVGELGLNFALASSAITTRESKIHFTAASELEILIQENGVLWFNDSEINIILQALNARYPETGVATGDLMGGLAQTQTDLQLNRQIEVISTDETNTQA